MRSEFKGRGCKVNGIRLRWYLAWLLLYLASETGAKHVAQLVGKLWKH